jgi:hypothetical protein
VIGIIEAVVLYEITTAEMNRFVSQSECGKFEFPPCS